MRSTGKYCAQGNLLLWTGHNYQNVFLKYEMTFVAQALVSFKTLLFLTSR
jgi:hypothetical protein